MTQETTASTETRASWAHDRERDEIVVRLPRLGSLLRQVLPGETVDHLRNAQREQLLAMRSLIDAAVRRLDEEGQKDRERTPQRIEIAVE